MIDMSKKYRYRGKGVSPILRILCIDLPGRFPVVSCDTDGTVYVHGLNGNYYYSNEESNHDLIEVNPYEGIPIDAKVLVRGSGLETWHRRYFAGVSDSGKPMAWVEGTTSWSTLFGSIPWDELKLPEE